MEYTKEDVREWYRKIKGEKKNMGFLGNQNNSNNDEYEYEQRLDVLLIRKTVREDYEINELIRNIAKKECTNTMIQQNENINLILQRLEALEKALQERFISEKQEQPSAQDMMLERLISKKNDYQARIESLDAQIDSYYGRITRKGGEVDKKVVDALEADISTYKAKVAALEPVLDALVD